MHVEENVPLSSLTTFRTGGPARFLLTLATAEELPDAAEFARYKKLQLIPIGSGSNMLAPDRGVEAVFVRLTASDYSVATEGTVTMVSADAGLGWDALVHAMCEKGLWGIENLSAIPGTVGAAAVQNISAYGAAVGSVIDSVVVYDFTEGVFRTLQNNECAFGYRTSIFKKTRDRYFIVKINFRLSQNGKPNIAYKDLKNHFAYATEPITLVQVRTVVMDIRAGKFPPLDVYGTAGSFFLNPVLDEKEAKKIQEHYSGMPLFPMPEGGVKVPLAWIMDKVLSMKGERVRHAFLWEQQPLVVTSENGALSSDVLALAKRVQDTVKEKTGLEIHPEVRILSE